MQDTANKPATKLPTRHSSIELQAVGVHSVTLALLRAVLAQLTQNAEAPQRYLDETRAKVTKDLELTAGGTELSEEERQLVIKHGRVVIERIFETIVVKQVSAGPTSRN